jgi:hypothetical protein
MVGSSEIDGFLVATQLMQHRAERADPARSPSVAFDQVTHQPLGQSAVAGAARHIAVADENLRRRIGPRRRLTKAARTIGVTSHLAKLCEQKLRVDIVRLLRELRRKSGFRFFVSIELHQGARTREHQVAVLYAKSCSFVRLHQSLFGTLLGAEHSGESVASGTVTRRQGDRALEGLTRFGNTLQGEARSAERRPRLAVLLIRCNELARMRVSGLIALGLIADACERETRRAKPRIEHQSAFELRDALFEVAARRQQQREIRAELGIAGRELDAAREQRLGIVEPPESMPDHGEQLQRCRVAGLDCQ